MPELVYRTVKTGEFTFELRDRITDEKVNIADKLRELEAQGKFTGKKF